MYASEGELVSFTDYIAHSGAMSLEDFCAHVNEVGARWNNEPLLPEIVLEQYEHLKTDVAGWLEHYGARYSKLFLHQLATQSLDNSCSLRPALFCQWLYGKICPYDVFNIYDEICTLEWASLPKDAPLELRPMAFQTESPRIRKTVTKKATPFKGKLLAGFWHKHHSQAGFIFTNILLQHKKPRTKVRIERFEKEAFPEDTAIQGDWDAYTKLATHEYTVATYEERVAEGIVTGEWIIYAQHEGKNYYLTLATHKEPDEEILKRVALCRDDFSFLSMYPQFEENL